MYEWCCLRDGNSQTRTERNYYAVDFAVLGDLRFLSHQEMLRLLGRACARAQVPVRQSGGFNPRPRISLPLPRPVGIASDAERAVLELTESISPSSLAELLHRQVPQGMPILATRRLESRGEGVPRLARYSVPIPDGDRRRLAADAARRMQFEPIPYERFVHKDSKYVRMDLRPYIESIVVGDDEVHFELHVTGGGSARPAEVCDVLGLGGANVNHLIRRREILWQRVSTETW